MNDISTTGYVIIIISGQGTLLMYDAVLRGIVNSKKHWVILLVKRSVYAIVRCYVPCHEPVHLNDIKIILCQRRNIKLTHMDLRACLLNKCCLIGYQLKHE